MRTTQKLSAVVVATMLSLSSVGTANASTMQPNSTMIVSTPNILFQPPSVPKNLHGECFPLELPEPMFVRDEDHGKEFYTGTGGALGSGIGMFAGSFFGPVGTIAGGVVGSGLGAVLGSILYHAIHRPASPMITAP